MTRPPVTETPETRLSARLLRLGRTLASTPHLDRYADCGCLRCRARTWSHHGYPTGTLGDGTGSRTADPTSSTERAALNPPRYRDLLARWDAAVLALTSAAIDLNNLVALLNATAVDDSDPIAVGRGNCLRCEKFCIGDGGNNRLRSGLCHPCHMGFRRWRALNPDGNTADYIRHNPARVPA